MHVRFTTIQHQAAFARMRASVDGVGANPHLVSLLFPDADGAAAVEGECRGGMGIERVGVGIGRVVSGGWWVTHV